MAQKTKNEQIPSGSRLCIGEVIRASCLARKEIFAPYA